MEPFDIAGVLLAIAAVLAYVNYKFIRLPHTIGLMLLSLVISLLLVLIGQFFPGIEEAASKLVAAVDFDEVLMEIMLGYLLFAGSLHVNLNDLAKQKFVIGLTATLGVVISTFLVGGAAFLLTSAFGIEIKFVHCLLFGALISPTDPVAVLGILKTSGAPKSLETKITGESLFNDGVGVVVFLLLLGVAKSGGGFDAGEVGHLVLVEVVGGIAFGLALGGIGYLMLRRVDQYQLEILITLALATGGYALAGALHTSGPLAMVVAGLMLGNQGRRLAMTDVTRQRLDSFWELIDEFLNAILFVLIGLEVLILSFTGNYLLAGLLAIPVVLLARFIAVGTPILLLKRFRTFSPRVIRTLTWGGLRGGISVALALGLPSDLGETRDLFIAATYVVVIFSISVQGLTLKYVVPQAPGATGAGTMH